MSLTESQLIKRYFSKLSTSPLIVRGVGDDAALLAIPSGYEWVTSVDTLVENTHFSASTPVESLGHKSLAVSLSDMAAMGATPKVALLALTLPSPDEKWLDAFTAGFFALANDHHVELIGGNMTRGPLTISVVVEGIVPKGEALLRSGAEAGDLVCVTGTLGDAGAALDLLKQKKPMSDFLLNRLYYPTARITEGMALRKIATATIDISDGLMADLERLCEASQVGARIFVDQLPLSKALLKQEGVSTRWNYALSSGDDYELCFTIPRSKQIALKKIFSSIKSDFHVIGEITSQKELSVIDENNQKLEIKRKGYEHFQ